MMATLISKQAPWRSVSLILFLPIALLAAEAPRGFIHVTRPDQRDGDEIQAIAEYGAPSIRTVRQGHGISELVQAQCGAAAALAPVHPLYLRALKAINPNVPDIQSIDLNNLDAAEQILDGKALIDRDILLPACAHFADPDTQGALLPNGVQSITKILSIPFDVQLFADIANNQKRREALRNSTPGASPLKEEISNCRQRLGSEEKWSAQLDSYFQCLNALDAIVNTQNNIRNASTISGRLYVRAPTNAADKPKIGQ
jgi:hypothetical protein